MTEYEPPPFRLWLVLLAYALLATAVVYRVYGVLAESHPSPRPHSHSPVVVPVRQPANQR